MRVAKLQIKNFLSIGEVELKPGKITQIVGANNQGKTSILRALEVAVSGGNDGSLVKRGETEAEIIVQFDDMTAVRRRIKSDGTSKVEVRKGEFKADKPQSLLDSLFASGTFNPLELLEAKKRTEVLLSAIPIRVTEEMLAEVLKDCPVGVPPVDYDQHGLKVAQMVHKMLFSRRAEANKEAKARQETARVKRDELPEMPTTADKRTVAEIQKENGQLEANIKAERAKADEVAAYQKSVENAETWIRQATKKVSDIKVEIAKLESLLEEKKKSLVVAEEDEARAHENLEIGKAQFSAAGPDQKRIEECNAAIQKNLQELNLRAQMQNVREKQDHVRTLEMQAADAEKFAEQLDAAVKAVGTPFRESLISQAQLPVAGLTFEDDEFKLDGCSIDNLSTSKAMSLALAVARTTAGQAKLICLDGAEALDETTWALLLEQIKDDDFQYFVTKVGDAFEGADSVEMKQGAAVGQV